MQTNPAVEQNKNIKWSESPWNQSDKIAKGLWRKGFAMASRDVRVQVHDVSLILLGQNYHGERRDDGDGEREGLFRFLREQVRARLDARSTSASVFSRRPSCTLFIIRTRPSCRRSTSALSRSMCLRRRGHLFPARHNSERRQRRLLPHPFLCASTKLCTEAVGNGILDKPAFCCSFFFKF